MSLKVGIFTTNSVDKLHPRIEMQQAILTEAGFNVEIIKSATRREGFFYELLNLLSLKYFKWGFIHKNKRTVNDFDVVHIYDLQLLPLAKYAKNSGKRVLYETLDDNVYLNFHAVAKKLPFIKLFKSSILKRKAKFERNSAENYCDHVIVNSANLLENFNKADLIYYASHLESLSINGYHPDKKSAFIYIGKLTKAKGAEDYAKMLDEHKIPMLFVGKAFDAEANELINRADVQYIGNFNSIELMSKLKDLIGEYNLIGLSVIHPENKSYKFQEANKDIDYLAMSMPFVGNDRPPTVAKLKEGAGVLLTEYDAIKALIKNDEAFYDVCSRNCSKLYLKFSQAEFKSKLLSIYTRK